MDTLDDSGGDVAKEPGSVPLEESAQESQPIQVERVGSAPEMVPQTPSLEDLIRTAEPVIEAYLASQEAMHEKSIELEKDIVAANARQARWMMVGLFSISAIVLAFAGALFWIGRPDAGIDLIQLIAAIGGVGFGGYGIARSRLGQGEGE